MHGSTKSWTDLGRLSGFNVPPLVEIPARTELLSNSALMSTCTPAVHSRWESETARTRTGHPPLYAEAKLNEVAYISCSWLPHVLLLRDCSSFFMRASDNVLIRHVVRACALGQVEPNPQSCPTNRIVSTQLGIVGFMTLDR